MAKNRNKEIFLKRLEAAKQWNTAMAAKWREYDRIYQGVDGLTAKDKKYLHSELYVPWVWQTIETMKPRIADPEPRFQFMPVESGDRRLSDILNVIIRQQLKADQFVVKQFSFIHDALVYGIAVGKVTWLQETQEYKMRDAEGNIYPRKLITQNRPTITYVDPFDFFPDPAATNDSDMRWCFHRIWMTMDELKMLEQRGTYNNVGRIDRDAASEGTEKRSLFESDEESKARRGEERFPVYEMYDRNGWLMSMCGDAVLRDGETPYFHRSIPFATFSTIRNPRSLVGTSETEKLREPQNAVWIKENQRIDSVNYANNYGVIMDPNIPEAEDFAIHPGFKLTALAGQRFDQVRHDANTGPLMDEKNDYLTSIQQLSGNSPLSPGVDASMLNIDNSTATGVSIMQEEGNKRMALKKLEFRLFESRLAKLMAQLNHQYLSAADIQRIVGTDLMEGYRPIAPYEIPMFLDVLPVGMNESLSRAVEKNTQLELLNILQGMHGAPMNDGTIFDIKHELENTLRLYEHEPSTSFQYPSPEGPFNPSAAPGVAMHEQAPGIEEETGAVNEVMDQ